MEFAWRVTLWVLPCGLSFAQTGPATMPAPMAAPVPVQIPVPIPSTITAPSQPNGQPAPPYQPDQPDLPCPSRDEDEAVSGVRASADSRIEGGRHQGCD